MNKFLVLSAVLIGLYIVAANAPGIARTLGAAGSAGSEYAKTLQGR